MRPGGAGGWRGVGVGASRAAAAGAAGTGAGAAGAVVVVVAATVVTPAEVAVVVVAGVVAAAAVDVAGVIIASAAVSALPGKVPQRWTARGTRTIDSRANAAARSAGGWTAPGVADSPAVAKPTREPWRAVRVRSAAVWLCEGVEWVVRTSEKAETAGWAAPAVAASSDEPSTGLELTLVPPFPLPHIPSPPPAPPPGLRASTCQMLCSVGDAACALPASNYGSLIVSASPCAHPSHLGIRSRMSGFLLDDKCCAQWRPVAFCCTVWLALLRLPLLPSATTTTHPPTPPSPVASSRSCKDALTYLELQVGPLHRGRRRGAACFFSCVAGRHAAEPCDDGSVGSSGGGANRLLEGSADGARRALRRGEWDGGRQESKECIGLVCDRA